MSQFTRLQSTPVLAKGSSYGGVQADALAAPAVCWDGTRYVMTVSIWNTAGSKWHSAFFTSDDLVTWAYVASSLRSPGGGDYILGNSGLAWFDSKYWFAYAAYPSGDLPDGVTLEWSTDLVNWTQITTTVGSETFGADPALTVSGDGTKLELWCMNSSRQTIMFDTATPATAASWTSRGIFHVKQSAAVLNYGEPEVHYRNGVRHLVHDRAVDDGERSIGMLSSTSMSRLRDTAHAELVWNDYGVVLAPEPANAWEDTNVFDGAVILTDRGDGRGTAEWMLYAGGDTAASTDNTNSSIGLAYRVPPALQVFPTGWGKRAAITIPAAQVGSGGVTNFSVLLTEANLPAGIFTDARSDGGDIRFSSDSAGATQLPSDVILFDADDDKATVRVKASLSSAADNTIYVWYGNADAEMLAGTDTYGQYNAYDADWKFYWPLVSLASRVAPDSSVFLSGATLTFNTSSKIDSGWTLAGTESIQAVTGTAGNTTGNITVSAWAKPTNSTHSARILSHWGSGGVSQWLLHISSGKAAFARNSGATFKLPETTTTVSGGSWGWFVGGYDGTNTYAELNNANRNNASGALTASSTTHNIGFGCDAQDGGNKFTGTIDELQVHGTARAAAWLTTEYNQSNAPATFASAGTPEATAVLTTDAPTTATAGVQFTFAIEVDGAEFGATEITVTDSESDTELGSGAVSGTGTISRSPAGGTTMNVSVIFRTAGAHTITITNDSGWADPDPITVTVSAAASAFGRSRRRLMGLGGRRFGG